MQPRVPAITAFYIYKVGNPSLLGFPGGRYAFMHCPAIAGYAICHFVYRKQDLDNLGSPGFQGKTLLQVSSAETPHFLQGLHKCSNLLPLWSTPMEVLPIFKDCYQELVMSHFCKEVPTSIRVARYCMSLPPCSCVIFPLDKQLDRAILGEVW